MRERDEWEDSLAAVEEEGTYDDNLGDDGLLFSADPDADINRFAKRRRLLTDPESEQTRRGMRSLL